MVLSLGLSAEWTWFRKESVKMNIGQWQITKLKHKDKVKVGKKPTTETSES